jgi:GT2 family glycosyltransferase
MTTLSVLVCTYNRHELLAVALDALLSRTVEKPDQVVVVNGGDERADVVVRSYKSLPGVDVELAKTVNRSLAASRNVGLPHCTGDIIAMTDDDAEVSPDWVTQMKRVHAEHPEAGAVGGAVVGATSSQSLISRLADVVTFPSAPRPAYVRTLPGVNISYKREVVDRLGPQDESLFRGEDVDYNWRVHKLGYRVYCAPEIRVLHHHRPTWRKFLQQHYMYGRAYYLVRRKWPGMYCVYPHALRRPRDWLKAAYFVVAVVLDPLQAVMRLPSLIDRALAAPILIANSAAWRGGMVYQKLLSRGR